MTETVKIALIVAAAPTIAAIASVIVSLKNAKKIDTLHDSVNGKMEKLLKVSEVAAAATGKEEGIAQEKSDQADRENKK